MRAQDARIGRLLGEKYRLQELLGRGGMGRVYGARHEGTGRSVAIKLLHSELVSQPDLVRRVSREARLAVEAAHPNVVEVLDAGADEAGVPYLVLERLYGEPLDHYVGTPLSLRATAQVLLPVVNALVSLHRAGIVHRDIKPANIFLDRSADGRVTPKLLDFGLAKALERDGTTRSAVALGTPAYMAPEQAFYGSIVGPAADVWSIAVVFVHFLTGELPFANQANRGFAALRVGLGPTDLASIPEPVAAVLRLALDFEPLSRPPTMDIFRSEMATALRQVDGAIAWPSEATVSYSPSEIEPEIRQPPAPRVPAESALGSGASESLRARPPHLVTRTLSKLWTGAAAARRRHWLVPPLLLAAGLASVWVLTGERASRQNMDERREPPKLTLVSHSQPSSPTEHARQAPATVQPTPSDPPPALSKVRASASAAPRRLKVLTPSLPPAPAEPSAKSSDSPSSLIGANRSPIIE